MSKLKIAFYACLLMMIFGAAPAGADEETGNFAYVKTSKHGRSYAKCIPAELYGSKGVTKVYIFREGEDQLESSYSWYSKEVYLSDRSGGVSVVRLGPWARGQTAKREDLAIGFYFSGEMLKEYSTLDIAGTPDNVSRSKSHSVLSHMKITSGHHQVFLSGAAKDSPSSRATASSPSRNE